MLAELARQHLDRCLVETDLPYGTRYRGKVRDVYHLPSGLLLLVTTDRISAFDHVLPQPIPFKGQVLNTLAAHAFKATADLVPNHVVAVPDPNVTVARACTPFPVEFVVRGFLAGHAWRVYRSGGRVLCGVRLPDGLREGERLPEPVLTPTTKAREGHDEDVTPEEIVRRGLMAEDDFEAVRAAALRLFERGSRLAEARGLLLADTKYEFGRDPEGRITLIDEVHTPDSSRFYHAEGHAERVEAGQPLRQLSKEFVREWLLARGFDGSQERPPDLPDDFRCEVAARYAELYEALTGTPFQPDTHPDPLTRVRTAVAPFVEA